MIIDDIKRLLEEHLTNQPFYAVCSECGSHLLNRYVSMDNDLDITVEVSPCECWRNGDDD